MKTNSVLVCILAIIGLVGITRCQATLTSADCSGDVASCTGIANAECVGENPTCQCQPGYAATSDGTACTAIGLDGACTTNGDCTLVTNAVCTSSKCQCANGYIKNGNVCDKVFGSTCSGTASCQGLEHSACTDGKCGCASGFAENHNICVQESGAVSVKSAVGLVFGCLIMLLVRSL